MDDLVKRADEALKDVTPGPWTVEYKHGNTRLMMGDACEMCDATHYPWVPESDADWHFIAAARELVPAMRDRIEADAKRIAKLERDKFAMRDERDTAKIAAANYADFNHTWRTRAEAAEARVKVLEEAAFALREAQRAYMADRGNNDLGQMVGIRAAELDAVLGVSTVHQGAAHAAEARVKVLEDALRAWLELAWNCSIEEGVCCCGEDMKTHSDPMNCGHSPVDHGAYIASILEETTRAALEGEKT